MNYVLLTGADIGNRQETLARAVELISERVGAVIRTSRIYQSEPWGFSSNTVFLNQAILVNSCLEPEELLDEIQKIELDLGRTRQAVRYTSRTIDIDILCLEELVYRSERLEIPHARLHERRFALDPLVEVAADWKHPIFQKAYSLFLNEVSSQPVIA